MGMHRIKSGLHAARETALESPTREMESSRRLPARRSGFQATATAASNR